ncbi:MAG: phosphoribosylaminoimidazolesuccinocarboxamide synthase [Aerococcus sp.]|nr:phosphoribosylaminoimidazolesuccinocarboxamide synthase [Aerococcus sp.]
MKKQYTGKTKDVYRTTDGHLLLKFKDDVTGVDGQFDPGANQIALSIAGVGKKDVKMSTYFFNQLRKQGIPTHFVTSDLEEATMTVVPAKIFGKGLEVITRYRAVGSFIRRYGAYIDEGSPLDEFVEITLKDDERMDPPITEEALVMLGIMTPETYQAVVTLNRQIARLIRQELAEHGLELYDLKLEFGRRQDNDEILLIDEISGGNMRVFKDGKYIEPLHLADYFEI